MSQKTKTSGVFPVCIFAVALFFFANVRCMAQEEDFLTVDYKKIEQFVQKEDAQFEKLVQRFVSVDTTLTLDELASIYYGSFYSTKYSYSDASEKVRESMKNKDYAAALKLCKKELEKSPASLDLLQKAAACSYYVGEESDAYYQKIVQIIDVIFASGDGKTEKTAFKVVAVSDEYFLLYGVFEVNLKQQALVGHCDRMTVYSEDDPDDTLDLYFDVSLHLSRLNSIFGGFDTDSGKSAKKSKKKK